LRKEFPKFDEDLMKRLVCADNSAPDVVLGLPHCSGGSAIAAII